MADARQCDAICCTAKVGPGKFLCLHHWRQVPRDLQQTINRRYRALRQGFAFLRDAMYLQACVSAIDSIARGEGVQGENPYRRLLVAASRLVQPAAEAIVRPENGLHVAMDLALGIRVESHEGGDAAACELGRKLFGVAFERAERDGLRVSKGLLHDRYVIYQRAGGQLATVLEQEAEHE